MKIETIVKHLQKIEDELIKEIDVVEAAQDKLTSGGHFSEKGAELTLKQDALECMQGLIDQAIDRGLSVLKS